MRTKLWGEWTEIENGFQSWQDAQEFAEDQYTEFGNIDQPEQKISLADWFSSENDWYFIESESRKDMIILVGNGPYTAYRKGKHVLGEIPVKIGGEKIPH
jgi:5-formaminoimidazole-4-carboxamide-1-beta-D-ribofuranosyl 5'-monophosphate synthetase